MTNDVTFELPQPELESYTWMLFDEHGASSVPPLLEGSTPFGRPSESGVPRSLRINGFTYVRVSRAPGWNAPGNIGPWGMPDGDYSLDDVRRWRTEWLPQAERICNLLEGFDPATVPPGGWEETLSRQADAYTQVFGGIHRTAVSQVHIAGARFREAWRAHFGRERDADLETLFQGIDNCSLQRATMLWDLSRLLREDEALSQALDRGGLLPQTPRSDEFQAGLTALLECFGYTSNADLQDQPTWREDTAIPLAAIRAYARIADGRGPRDAAESQRARREAIEAELRGLAETGAEVAALLPKMVAAQELLPNLEDHNYYADQSMAGASRLRWLTIGRWLQGTGVLDAADDVFYLYREELLPALEGAPAPSKPEIAARRDHLAACRAAIPPAVIGRPLPIDEEAPIDTLQTTESRVLRGIGASPGSYRGRARVIEALADASTLVEGDILVCRNTTPPWTPFFGIIGALVTNSGGSLSHASVVAREFGLPAVVGTVYATAMIHDGDTLTVDGTNGVVIIETGG